MQLLGIGAGRHVDDVQRRGRVDRGLDGRARRDAPGHRARPRRQGEEGRDHDAAEEGLRRAVAGFRQHLDDRRVPRQVHADGRDPRARGARQQGRGAAVHGAGRAVPEALARVDGGGGEVVVDPRIAVVHEGRVPHGHAGVVRVAGEVAGPEAVVAGGRAGDHAVGDGRHEIAVLPAGVVAGPGVGAEEVEAVGRAARDRAAGDVDVEVALVAAELRAQRPLVVVQVQAVHLDVDGHRMAVDPAPVGVVDAALAVEDLVAVHADVAAFEEQDARAGPARARVADALHHVARGAAAGAVGELDAVAGDVARRHVHHGVAVHGEAAVGAHHQDAALLEVRELVAAHVDDDRRAVAVRGHDADHALGARRGGVGDAADGAGGDRAARVEVVDAVEVVGAGVAPVHGEAGDVHRPRAVDADDRVDGPHGAVPLGHGVGAAIDGVRRLDRAHARASAHQVDGRGYNVEVGGIRFIDALYSIHIPDHTVV